MIFPRRKKEPRTCEKGHTLEESWEQCPFCAAEGNDGDESAAEHGRGAVVVSKKVASRCLVGWIVVTEGEHRDKDFRISSGRNLIGKGAEADIVVKDPHLSERHALIEVPEREGKRKILLSDLGSKYGTFLNGKPVTEPKKISDGDLLRLGQTEFRFRSYE